MMMMKNTEAQEIREVCDADRPKLCLNDTYLNMAVFQNCQNTSEMLINQVDPIVQSTKHIYVDYRNTFNLCA